MLVGQVKQNHRNQHASNVQIQTTLRIRAISSDPLLSFIHSAVFIYAVSGQGRPGQSDNGSIVQIYLSILDVFSLEAVHSAF